MGSVIPNKKERSSKKIDTQQILEIDLRNSTQQKEVSQSCSKHFQQVEELELLFEPEQPLPNFPPPMNVHQKPMTQCRKKKHLVLDESVIEMFSQISTPSDCKYFEKPWPLNMEQIIPHKSSISSVSNTVYSDDSPLMEQEQSHIQILDICMNGNEWLQKKRDLAVPAYPMKILEDHENEVELETEVLDYSAGSHLPLESYAIVVQKDLIKYFTLDNTVKHLMDRLGMLKYQSKPTEKQKRLPYIKQPYYIHSLGVIYIGQWKYGKPCSQGIMYYNNGLVQEGYFEDGQPHGYLRQIEKDGSYYEGYFFHGVIHGVGKLVLNNGFMYEGRWVQGKPHGKGKEIWGKQSIYDGEYQNGLKQGQGTFTWFKKDGSKKQQYTGQFQANLFEGNGTYVWSDGRHFAGGWKNGKMQGYGVFTWKDGKRYEGNYAQDLKHGYGSMIWPETFEKVLANEQKQNYPIKQWNGEWKFGMMDGEGELIYYHKTYKGRWQQGQLIGSLNEASLYEQSNMMSSQNQFDQMMAKCQEYDEIMINGIDPDQPEVQFHTFNLPSILH